MIVASAGNSQQTNPGVANYPAAYPYVIGVGATDDKDQIAPFSSQGNWVDLVAPGVESSRRRTSKTPKLVCSRVKQHRRSLSHSSPAPPCRRRSPPGSPRLMIAARPDLTPDEVESLMKGTARDLGITGPDLIYGAGRIEAGAAVAAARAYVRPVPPTPPSPSPSPAKPKVRKIGGHVLIRTRRHKGKLILYGKIKTAKKCQSTREVVLFAKKRKKPLAKTKTNAHGRYKLILKKAPRRRIRIKVRAKKVNSRLLCKGQGTKYIAARGR